MCMHTFVCLIVVHNRNGKAVKKRRGKQTRNDDGFWIDFGWILGPFWEGKSTKIDPKHIEKMLQISKCNKNGTPLRGSPPFGVQRRPNASHK